MQTTTQYNSLAKYSAIITTLFVALLSGNTQAEEAVAQLAALEANNKWQVARLFEPTSSERNLEDKGYIMIYDNLPDTTVDKALDNNFDRIENMMFTRVVVTDEEGLPALDESGEIVKEDDGC
jgi:fructose-bisphosphate aldolase class 1